VSAAPRSGVQNAQTVAEPAQKGKMGQEIHLALGELLASGWRCEIRRAANDIRLDHYEEASP
jgi:hypothetical protein